jgi:filamentous hemagglutinin family protein
MTVTQGLIVKRLRGLPAFWICSGIALLGWLGCGMVPANAQIAGDNSVGTRVNGDRTAPCVGACVITEGTVVGDHLFHSFRQFSIPTGGEAIFEHGGVRNIFLRVTGRLPSNIDGRISADTASLILLNPNGIIFGPNATLNIGGSFIGSTADRLLFDNGAQFRASDRAFPANLLTVSVPIGLQFGANPGRILIQGTGNNLFFDSQTSEVVRDFRSPGLTVQSGQTLGLIGGNVTLRGGNLTAPQGRIDIGSVGSGSNVSLIPANLGWRVDYGETQQWQTIRLTQAASIDTSGEGGGKIQLRGQQVTLMDGSALLANSLGNLAGGRLTIRADDLQVTGLSTIAPFASGIFADAASTATVRGGNVRINVVHLQVTGGAQIGVNTFGAADAGTLTIRSDDISLDGGSPLGPSGLFTDVAPNATGIGGNLTLEAGRLQITTGAQVSATSNGLGHTGNLTVRANDVRITGVVTTPAGESASGLLVNMGPRAIGQGGSLVIDADRLQVRDGAQVSSGTIGAGDAGSITVRARDVDLSGGAEVPSGIFALVDVPASGIGGTIRINAERLQVIDGAQIATSTLGSGNAGALQISASESIRLRGRSPGGFPSGLFASTLNGTGSGGDLTVATDQLVVEDGASISVRSALDTQNPEQGAAGNLNLTAGSIMLDNQATLTADTVSGSRGNINLQSDLVVLRRASRISTNAQSTASGGNIRVDASNGFILAGSQENSDITANATLGNGGRVDIRAEGILGIEPRPELTASSDITASSEFGISGVVNVNAPEVDPVQEQASLPDTPRSSELLQGCQPRSGSVASRFIVTGHQGLQPNPYESLSDSSVLEDIQLPRQWAEVSVDGSNSAHAQTQPTNQIGEAQGWRVNDRGEVVLVAEVSPSPAHGCSFQTNLRDRPDFERTQY